MCRDPSHYIRVLLLALVAVLGVPDALAGLIPWQPGQWSLETEGNPTLHDFVEMRVHTPIPGAIWYKLERVTNATGQTLHSDETYPMWTDRTEFVFRFTREFRGSGTVHLRISAWSVPPSDMWGTPGNDGIRLTEYDVLSFDFDHSYEGLHFQLTAQCGDQITDPELIDRHHIASPWDCIVEATPFWEGGAPPRPIDELMAQAESFHWTLYQPTGELDVDTLLPLFRYASGGSVRTTMTVEPRLKLALARPGIAYVGLQLAWSGTRGYGVRQTTASGLTPSPMPEISNRHVPIPIAIPPGGVNPQTWLDQNLATNYPTAMQPPLMLGPIPGDQRVAPQKNRVTLFDGGALQLPLGPAEGLLYPRHFEIELPANELSLVATAYQPTSGNTRYGYTVEDVTATGEMGSEPPWPGYRRLELNQVSENDEWSYSNWALPLFFRFLPGALPGETRLLRIRPLGGGGDPANTPGDWHVFEATYAALPNLTLPKRLVTSLTWATQSLFSDPNVDDFLARYKALGLNTVPFVATNFLEPGVDFSQYLFTPAQRVGPAWDGTLYGLEHGTFGRGWYNGNAYQPGMIELLTSWPGDNCGEFAQTSEIEPCLRAFLSDSGEFDLDEPQLTQETDTWMAAIDYFHFDSEFSGAFDVAYDGIFRTRDLQNLSAVLAHTNPDYLFIDQESFPWFYTQWLPDVTNSSLAEARRLNGETDRKLAYRLANELLDSIIGAIRGACAGCDGVKIGLYDAGSVLNYGYQVFTWDMQNGPDLDPTQGWTHDLLSQRSIYGIERHLPRHVVDMRRERENLEQTLLPDRTLEMIPWMSTGAAGELDSEIVFDLLAQTFVNGATGFCYWAPVHFDDMADHLHMAEVIGTLAWPESRYILGLNDLQYPMGINGEDIVIDGSLEYARVSGVSLDPLTGEPVAIVSAMGLDGAHVIAVSPRNGATSFSFGFDGVVANAWFLVQNLRHETQARVQSDATGSITLDETLIYGGADVEGTVVRIFPEAGSCTAPFESAAIPDANRTPAGDVTLNLTDPNPPSAVSGYNVYRAVDPAGPFTRIAQNVVDADIGNPGVQFTDPGSGSGPSYYYRVVAYQAACDAEGP